jgi:hypothetical protein
MRLAYYKRSLLTRNFLFFIIFMKKEKKKKKWVGYSEWGDAGCPGTCGAGISRSYGLPASTLKLMPHT